MWSKSEIINKINEGYGENWITETFPNILSASYWDKILKVINKDEKLVTPNISEVFNFLTLTNPLKFKCLILCSEPNKSGDCANGLGFGIREGRKTSGGIKNFLEEAEKEFKKSFSYDTLFNGDLKYLADQGVILLNCIHTAIKNNWEQKHDKIGWQEFTKDILMGLDSRYTFMSLVMGSDARNLFNDSIKRNKLNAVFVSHPNYNKGENKFIDSNCLIKINSLLIDNGLMPIKWVV